MELPLVPVTPVPAAGAGNAAATAPAGAAMPVADGAVVPDFAALLAAGLALPEGTDETAEPAIEPASAGLPTGAELLPVAASPAPGAPDPALALMLAVAAQPVAAATMAAPHPGTPQAAGNRTMDPALPVPDSGAATARAEPPLAPAAAPALALQEASARAATTAPAVEIGTENTQMIGEHLTGTAARAAPAPAPALPAATALRAPVGAEGWDAQLGRAMLWMAGERHQMAEVRLNPPDLGPLEIQLRMTGENSTQASVTFASPHADVRAALESALPRLREMLAESGLSLGQASVNSESFRDAGDTPRQGSGGDGATHAAGGALMPGAAIALPRAGAGLVDVFA